MPVRKLLRETRAPLELAGFWLRSGTLDRLPRGDGHPVLFLPGFTMGDEALRPMASVFERLGYAVYGWGQGRNLGLRIRTLERLKTRLQEIQTRHGRQVSLIGWSAGGLYARELARAEPERTRRIVIFGSPILLEHSGYQMVDLARSLFEGYLDRRGSPSFAPIRDPPPVPCTAIHSKSDGIVGWRTALETPGPNVENIEVKGTHLSLGFNPEVLRIVADRLAMKPHVSVAAEAAGRRPRKQSS